jgi:DNA mismatch repair protein MSH4
VTPRNVNNKSLVIVDELGRATGTRDGLAIATAMSEGLLQSNAIVYFATHFAELAKGFANNIGVVNRHLKTVTEFSESAIDVPIMKMMYRVAEGQETEVSYGIALAKAVGFPATFIAHAEKVAAELRAQSQVSKRDRQELEEAKRRKLVANLVRQLQLAHESDAGDEELAEYLKQIHDDFWAKMLGSSDDNDGVIEDDSDEDVGEMDDMEEVGDDYDDEDIY